MWDEPRYYECAKSNIISVTYGGQTVASIGMETRTSRSKLRPEIITEKLLRTNISA